MSYSTDTSAQSQQQKPEDNSIEGAVNLNTQSVTDLNRVVYNIFESESCFVLGYN
jgi:hypothetical protein